MSPEDAGASLQLALVPEPPGHLSGRGREAMGEEVATIDPAYHLLEEPQGLLSLHGI